MIAPVVPAHAMAVLLDTLRTIDTGVSQLHGEDLIAVEVDGVEYLLEVSEA